MPSVTINNVVYRTKKAAEESVREQLQTIVVDYNVTLRNSLNVTEHDDLWAFLYDLLQHHPELNELTGTEDAVTFHVMQNPMNRKAVHLEITLSDGNRTSFSWKKCISQLKQTKRSLVNMAMRSAIYPQIQEFKSKCKRCIKCNSSNHIEIDHCGAKEFRHLYTEFTSTRAIDDLATKSINFTTNFDTTNELTAEFATEWKQFHKANAQLQALCKQCHANKTFNK